MEKVITVDISKSKFLRANPQWQYNHGQKLQFMGVELPPYYEVHFSNSINGEAKKQLGDSSGVLIPFEYFQPGKSIYAWIYITDNDSGITQRQVEIPIHKKAICTDKEPTPEQSDIIEEAIGALNSALDEVDDRIEAALDSAKQSGEFDGTDGTTIWTTSQAPTYPNYTFTIANLVGTPEAIPKRNDLIFYDLKYYKITNIGETTVLSSLYVDVKDNNVLHKTGDEMLGALSMGANKITNLANGINNYDAVNLRQVKQMIADEGSTYRGSFNTKAALLAAPWQNVDKELPYYVDNKDFAIVQADESNNNECWRYMYTSGTGWEEQYKINDAPLSQAQIDALNSGITAVKVQKLDTVEPSAEVNVIEEVRVKNRLTQQWTPLPVTNKGVDLPETETPEEIYHTDFTITTNEDELIVEPTVSPTYLLNQIESGRWVVGTVNYNGSIYYATVVEAIEYPLYVRLICDIGNGEFLNIENEELGWKAFVFTAVSDSLFEELGQAVSEFSEELHSVEEFIGNPSDLNTADKSSIVNAINEVEAEKLEAGYFDFTWDGSHDPVPVTGVTGEAIFDAIQAGKLVFARVTVGSSLYPYIFSLRAYYSNTFLEFVSIDGSIINMLRYSVFFGQGMWSMDEYIIPDPAQNIPEDLGVAAVGSSEAFARADHVHAMPSAIDVGAIAAPSSPSSGDVLTYSNGAWIAAAPSGGGGGTSDYSDLSNKPQINGYTLDGDQSAADLEIEPEAFVVTITQNGSTSSADKTYSDTVAAISAGKRVVAMMNGYEYQLFSYIPNESTIVFTANRGTTAKAIGLSLGDAVGVTNITLGTYSKPSGGIPATDLESAVQASLNKANTALQSYTETDPTVPSWAKASSKPSYSASEVGAVAVAQGVEHAGEFVVVGSDGNITSVTMSVWQGGNY